MDHGPRATRLALQARREPVWWLVVWCPWSTVDGRRQLQSTASRNDERKGLIHGVGGHSRVLTFLLASEFGVPLSLPPEIPPVDTARCVTRRLSRASSCVPSPPSLPPRMESQHMNTRRLSAFAIVAAAGLAACG